MASNAREDTQSNSVAPNDNEVEVQSNANPTSETPQATDNVSTPEGLTPNKGDNKAHVKSAYWEYFDRLKVEGEWKAKCKFCKTVLSTNPRNGTKSLRNHVDRYCKRIKAGWAGKLGPPNNKSPFNSHRLNREFWRVLAGRGGLPRRA
ncbi:hypothetical protein Ahy_A07g032706 [Arachis hypogaea]|uniref:BED-type domain-containing protein n=1 Tax=Arachis hypogaea TaxID=3818 RepID=A0A445C7L2_ARAHY|nr:hypothetical protein Ahy_A07g032706 [Arachis hypogaea]